MDDLTDDFDAPANARRLITSAEKFGWRRYTTVATGVWRDKTVESVCVRLAKGHGDTATRLVATWEREPGTAAWSFRSAIRLSPFGLLNSRELTKVVTEQEVAA